MGPGTGEMECKQGQRSVEGRFPWVIEQPADGKKVERRIGEEQSS
jgi:hypothetical protein